jgi:hypothetical protein
MTRNSRRTATVVTNTPNPLTVSMAGALDVLRGLSASGRLGHRNVGITGDATRSYRGDLGPLQQFRGWNASNAIRSGLAMSLPMTGAPEPGSLGGR